MPILKFIRARDRAIDHASWQINGHDDDGHRHVQPGGGWQSSIAVYTDLASFYDDAATSPQRYRELAEPAQSRTNGIATLSH